MTISAFAATYTVNVSNNVLSLKQNNYTSHTFNLANANVTVNSSSNGGIALTINERWKNSSTNIAFNGVYELDFTGSYSTLTFGGSLNSNFDFTLKNAAVSSMVINGSPSISAKNGTRVSSVSNNNRYASLSKDSSSVISYNNGWNSWDDDDDDWDDDDDDWDDDDDDWDDRNDRWNDRNHHWNDRNDHWNDRWNDRYDDDRVSRYDYSTYLRVTVDNDGDYIREGRYSERDEVLYLTGLYRGVTLNQVMKNVNLLVLREYNDARVSGKWAWKAPDDGTKTESGTYTYVFTPSNTKDYEPVEIEVEFTDYDDYRDKLEDEENRRPGRPGDRWPSRPGDRWPSRPGDRWPSRPGNSWDSSPSYTRSITVRLPSGLNNRYVLNIYCDGVLVATYNLSSSDSGRTKTYTVMTNSNGQLTAAITVR